MLHIDFPSDTDWRGWIERWDRMQEHYIPRRQERFELMVQLIADTQAVITRILDIGCGTGSLMLPVLKRFPAADVYGIDFDPTLLALARRRLTDFGERVHLIQADLRDESWLGCAPGDVDAVVSATTLHWFGPEQVSRLYRQLGEILRTGGIFLCADHVRSSDANIQKAWEQHRAQMAGPQDSRSADDWDGFWDAYGKVLKIDIKKFRKELTEPWRGSEEGLPLEWHFERLKAVGFQSVECFWRLDCDAIYGAVR